MYFISIALSIVFPVILGFQHIKDHAFIKHAGRLKQENNPVQVIFIFFKKIGSRTFLASGSY